MPLLSRPFRAKHVTIVPKTRKETATTKKPDETMTLPRPYVMTNAEKEKQAVEAAEINNLIKHAVNAGHASAIRERRLSNGVVKDGPRPNLSRCSSETREINDLLKMLSGAEVEDGKAVMRERRKSRQAVQSVDATTRSAEIEAINERIQADKRRQDMADARSTRAQPQATGVRTRTKAQVQQDHSQSSLEQQVRWRLAFDQSRGMAASYLDSAKAPYMSMTTGIGGSLKRASSGDSGSPAFKRSNSSCQIFLLE
jgi:hypothetical protein